MTHLLALTDVATEIDEAAPERGSAIVVRAGPSDKNEGTTLFVASTDDEDRMMDIVRQDWKLAEFRANPVILDNHLSLRVVGRGIEAKVPKAGEEGDVGKLMIRVKWDLDAPDPSIRTVGHQHLNQFRNAGSVGFKHGKKTERHKLDKDHPAFREPLTVESWWGGKYESSGWYFEQNNLREFSSATIPANAAALQRALGGKPPATAAEQFLERMAGLDPADLERRLKVLEQTVPKGVAVDLRTQLADDATRGQVVKLLLPELTAELRSNRELRNVIRGLVESDPTVPTKSLEELILARLEPT